MSDPSRESPRVLVLCHNATGGGGVARVVANLSSALAQTQPVRVLSVQKNREHPKFPFDPRVRLDYIFDRSPAALAWREQHPDDPATVETTRRAPTRRMRRPGINAFVERRMREELASVQADVVISTRPILHWAAVEMTPPDVAVIGWDHLNYPARYDAAEQGKLLDEVLPRLDAWVTLTEADRRDYLSRFGAAAPRVEHLPNAVGMTPVPVRADRSSRVVVAAGRLNPVKGFDRAIEAWRPIARSHPDWQLHIYGEGPSRTRLRRQIASSGLQDHVKLKGFSRDIRTVLGDAELFLLSSRVEGFGMVLVEAMSQGTAAVTFDCPRGPSEIVTSGRNGEVVPDGDVPALTATLTRLLEDEEARRRLGEQALRDSAAYAMEPIADRWRHLIEDVSRRP